MPYLTKEMLLDLKPAAKPYKLSDAVLEGKKNKNQGVPGLVVRVCPGGAKTFAVQYRTLVGRKGWHPIGRFGVVTLEQARIEASKHLRAVSQGEDPGAQLRRDRDALTMVKLVEKYLEDYCRVELKPKTAAEYGRVLNKFFVPKFGSRKAKDFDSGDMASLLDPMRKTIPVQANRLNAIASGMFSLAETWKIRDQNTNPCRGQITTTEIPRDRRMVEKEIRALGAMLREIAATTEAGTVEGAVLQPESSHALAAVFLPMLTGFRKEETLGLRWDWVNLGLGLVVIPAKDHKTGKKTGKPRVVHLCQAAVKILEALPRFDEADEHPNPYVIIGHRHGQHLVQLQDVWERVRTAVDDQAKHEAKKHKKKTAPAVAIGDVHIHDLRRTFSSVAADMGYPELFISAMLGHSVDSVTQIYARLSNDPVRDAVEAVGARIAEWLG